LMGMWVSIITSATKFNGIQSELPHKLNYKLTTIYLVRTRPRV